MFCMATFVGCSFELFLFNSIDFLIDSHICHHRNNTMFSKSSRKHIVESLLHGVGHFENFLEDVLLDEMV